ncbi:MAG: apolipoprotein N-acyltransferase [Pirellulales bacterium]|nr:apolipoprotein N-acyltransferase [Pirellulales bacterium]
MGTIAWKAPDRLNAASTASRAEATPQTCRRRFSWLQSTLALGLLGSLLMFVAMPPCGLWPLAWIAPLPWLLLVREPVLAGKHPYRSVWVAGFAFWLAAIHWLRLPHPLTNLGWLALAFYLAFYVPTFVWLARVAVHRLGISVVIAAPVVWTGLELTRGHLLSGFTMASLSHTQIHWLAVIQGADVIGDYGISGLIMFAAACITRMMPWRGEKLAIWPILPLVMVLGSAVVYGQWRMSGAMMRPGPTVALIQGSIDAEWKADKDRLDAISREYFQLSVKALKTEPMLDLLVWPETMYRGTIQCFDDDFKPTQRWITSPKEWQKASAQNLIDLQAQFSKALPPHKGVKLPPPLLLGTDAVHFSNEKQDGEHFNSAQFVDRNGIAIARYDKMHPVMFGEYIPLAEYIPFLYKITPLTGGLTSGTKAVFQQLGGVRYAPNICYETVIPHLIRRQVLQLQAQGEEPDVLVNLTNDGWFRGSSELDMHLACGVFRAIEMRKPLVIAANTGFSASIDANGRILQQGARRAADVLIAKVQIDGRHSVYLQYGDWFSGICLFCCVGLVIVGCISARRPKSSAS